MASTIKVDNVQDQYNWSDDSESWVLVDNS